VAERSEAGWGIVQRLVDQGENALHIPVNVIVPKSQYSETLAAQIVVARCVALSMCVEVMLASVYFDNEAMLQTDKIDNVTRVRGLTPEMVSTFSP
jgi:hypothetical protein